MSESTDGPGTFTHVKGDLAWTLAEHRTPSDAVAMTRHLAAADGDRFELLGLVNECAFALYWDYFWNHVVAASFDAGGVDELARDAPSTLRYSGRGEYFDAVVLDAWDWVHPRHRWRLE